MNNSSLIYRSFVSKKKTKPSKFKQGSISFETSEKPKPKNPLTWSLRFRDKETEYQYYESKLNYQLMMINGALFIAFLNTVLSIGINPLNKSYVSFEFLGYKLILLAMEVPIYIISKKKAKYRENILFITLFVCFFFLAENKKKNIFILGRSYTFSSGIFIELVLLGLTISKINIFKKFFFIILTNVLCCFVYLPFEENYSENYFSMIHFGLNLITLLIFSYSLEKYDRRVYLEIKNREHALMSFKDLIKDLFPSPIVIAHTNTILFQNKEALNKFECKTREELLKSFKNIRVQKIIDDDNLHNEKSPSFENFDQRQEKIYHKENHCDLSLSLIDVINSYPFTGTEDNENSNEVKIIRSYQIDLHSGSKKYYDIKIKNINWEGKSAIIMIFSENKMIKRIQKLKEQALYKDRMLATVSHELRTPLNGVIGMLEVTQSLTTEKRILKNISIALRSSNYLLYMINDILDFHLMSNDKLRLNYQVFSLWELIKEVSKLIKFQAKLKNIKFKIESKLPEKDSKAVIRSDPNRIKQVLLNLIGNALKFTENDGSITVSVENNLEDKANLVQEEGKQGEFSDSYLIKVTDTGMGIKKEEQGKLFRLFSKLECPDKKKINETGIGLGLAISQNLVMILNDKKEDYKIKLQSEFGKGSCFYFPIKSGFEEINNGSLKTGMVEDTINEIHSSHTSPKRGFDKSRELTEKCRILIVDDDQINIIVAKSYLQSSGFKKYDIANNGLEAFQKIQNTALNEAYYDIVLMDCNMPIMSGFEATFEIRELIKHNKIPDLRIIACTANASQQDYEQCFQAGMDDYISKPFSKKDLMEKIFQNSIRK